MLTERLKTPKRCASAQPIGIAFVIGYKIAFTKKSKKDDGTGKATIVNTCNESDIVYGVLFEIDDDEDEIGRLDRAEGVSDGGYVVKENFTVVFDGRPISNVRTYVAPAERCQEGLQVYDWYLALVIAGAKQHELDEDYISKIIDSNKVISDPKDDRENKHEAMKVLKKAVFENVLSELKY